VGGGEHAVLHLLYARFWHKVMFDFGYVTSNEPFRRLFHQGLILGEDGRKMSKSMGNTINPDDVIRDHGADALRLFEMFLGPLEASKPWNTKGIEGITRFLQRVWRLIVDENDEPSPLVKDVPCTADQAFVLHSTIKKTREDIENLSFNTAIAQFMIFVNEFTSASVRPREAMEAFVCCLAPFAPHLAEELWMRLGKTTSVVLEPFPAVNETALVKSEVEIVVQVNSKVRGKVVVPFGADEATLEAAAMLDENVRRHLEGVQIRKRIIVPDKLVNFIVG
jgi:leucyl-tRNA synthetase